MKGYSAYAKAQPAALDGRGLEGAAFMKAARLLDTAANAPDDAKALAEALRVNTLLWTLVQAELTEPGGRLPDTLHADLASLSLFMDRSTAQMLNKPDTETLRAMSDVDRSIASGLLK